MSKLYAQFDADGVCTCVGTPNITGIEADYDCLGKKYVDGIWVDPESEEEKTEELELDENSIRGGYRSKRVAFIGRDVPEILKGGIA